MLYKFGNSRNNLSLSTLEQKHRKSVFQTVRGPGWQSGLSSTVAYHSWICTIQKNRFNLTHIARDKVCQLPAHGRWFSPGTPASSTSKTYRRELTEILLKVEFNPIQTIQTPFPLKKQLIIDIFVVRHITMRSIKRKLEKSETKNHQYSKDVETSLYGRIKEINPTYLFMKAGSKIFASSDTN